MTVRRAAPWPRTRRLAVAAGAALALICVAPVASAGCSVSATGVNFGGYDPFAAAPADGTGNIAVACDAGIAYSIALSSGSGTYSQRTMHSGPDVLAYNLYTGVSRDVVWGDGAGATASIGGSGSGSNTNFAVYGRIEARQNVRAGAYVDDIVVSVDF